MSDRQHYDAVVVGAGFAGLFMLHRLRQLGLSVRVFEKGSGVGGTWFWNRYPGARCDIESIEYSYQFDEDLQQEWEWSERYSPQAEILRYINHVADRFDLREHIQLNTRVKAAQFDDKTSIWTVVTDKGSARAKFVVFATGVLSSANVPKFKGLESFSGNWFHTGKWPREGVDFSGKRVAVVGTGSSGIQSIPIIAQQAIELTVFQRTPAYSVPAQNKPLDPDQVRQVKANYKAFREDNAKRGFGANFRDREELAVEATEAELQKEYDARWQMGGLPFLGAYADLLFDKKANETAARYIRAKIAELVEDPEVASLLTPDTVVGCKRLCSDSGYFETFNLPHVKLVDVSTQAIDEITPGGIKVGTREYPVDCIVFATGFDAMTGALNRIDIRGVDGQTLKNKWAEGPKTYLGLSTAGFPNMFIITGPGSPSVLSNMVPSIEQHVNWIADCIEHMKNKDVKGIEATIEAENQWVDHVNEIAGMSIYPQCNSWYLGSNIPGKPRVFMPCLGFPPYVEKCNEVAANDYEGFVYR
ncbi:MAG: flavin-containing monooxygenase [Pseudomonadales bacterium]